MIYFDVETYFKLARWKKISRFCSKMTFVKATFLRLDVLIAGDKQL